MKHLKNVLSILLLAVIVLTVLGVSFKIGEKIFFVYNETVKDSIQKDAPQHSKEIPIADLVPKADERAAEEAISGVKEPAPTVIVESITGQVKKISDSVTERNTAQPAQRVAAPVAKTEKPLAAVKPKETVPDVKPEAIAPAGKPVVKAPKPVEKQKVAATKKPETRKQYKIIAGSFSVKANADSLIGQLKANDYEPMVTRAETLKGQLYRVIVGSYRSLSLTKTEIGKLKKLGYQVFYILE